MPIVSRLTTWNDIEAALQIEPKHRGDALVNTPAAMAGWKHMFVSPFFASEVLQSYPPIQGHSLIAFGASVMVLPGFMDDEIAHPRPDINSRIVASIHEGQSVLANRLDVARANAGGGVDVVVLCGVWRDGILSPFERLFVQNALPAGFTECHAGYHIGRIVHETTSPVGREFLAASVVYRAIADFPELGRTIHLMNRESVQSMRASLGNKLFDYHEPVLRLRESDQHLLLAALSGQTDAELATSIGVTFSAVKARWRSTFARIEEVMPALVADADDRDGRGAQKRHRVIAYIRTHPEELRPYDWKAAMRATA